MKPDQRRGRRSLLVAQLVGGRHSIDIAICLFIATYYIRQLPKKTQTKS